MTVIGAYTDPVVVERLREMVATPEALAALLVRFAASAVDHLIMADA